MLSKAQPKRQLHLVKVDTEFQKKARQPGGISREAAIRRAQTALLELRPAMDSLIDDNLAALTQAAAGSQMLWPRPDWDTIYSTSSQIRDVGATAGFELLTLVAANLCDIVDECRNNNERGRPDIVQCHVTALVAFRQERYRDVSSADTPELATGLSTLLKLSKNRERRDGDQPT